MIQLEKVSFQNFLSFRDKQTIPLKNQGMVLIEGRNDDEGDSNRAGKTAGIVEPIVWVLFGRTIRGLKHDAVVNRFAGKDCWGKIDFTAHKTRYRVGRYRKHKKYKNAVRLWVEGKEKSFRHQEETQKRIEAILGCDYNSFVNSVVFGGAKPFASLTDAEQKKVLESFLHFEKLDAALQYTKRKIDRVSHELQEKERKRAGHAGSLASYRSGLQALNRSEEAWRKKQGIESDKITEQLRELDKQTDILDYSEQVTVAERALAVIEKKCFLVSHDHSIATNQVEQLQKALDKRERTKTDLPCPTCGQKVSARALSWSIDQLKKEMQEKESAANEIFSVLTRRKKEVAYARKELKRVQHKHNKAITMKSIRANARRELTVRLKETSETGAEPPFLHEIETLQSKYSSCLSKLLKSEFQMQALKKQISDLEFWVEGFGNRGVKALVVRQALPAMNRKLKEYSQEIFNGAANISFSPIKTNKMGVETELFNLKYVSRRGSESYLGESSGGRKRVDICILLVFSWLSRIANILIIDELLDSLDESGRESVLNILSSLHGTVICITHQRDLKDRFDKVWTVTKKHGRSTLETEAA